MRTPSGSRATVVIVSWNSAPDLDTCLAALPAGTPVVVIDNASDDASVDVARRHGACVTRLGANLGFARAVNLAVGRIDTPYTMLLNPDVVLAADAITRCVSALDDDPTIGIVGTNTRLADDRPEPPAARRDRSAVQIAIESTGLVHLSRRFDLQMIHDRSRDRDVEAVNGAALVIRTELLERLGGLDESVFMYLEDQDLCRRVRDAGYRVRFLTGAHAVHGNGTSTARGTTSQQARAYLHRIDADLEFLRRYGRRGEVVVATVAFALRSLAGLLRSTVRPGRRERYWAALRFSLRQLGGRRPAPPV